MYTHSDRWRKTRLFSELPAVLKALNSSVRNLGLEPDRFERSSRAVRFLRQTKENLSLSKAEPHMANQRRAQYLRYAGCLPSSTRVSKLCNSAADKLSSCDKMASRLAPVVAELAWRRTIGVGAFSPSACAF